MNQANPITILFPATAIAFSKLTIFDWYRGLSKRRPTASETPSSIAIKYFHPGHAV